MYYTEQLIKRSLSYYLKTGFKNRLPATDLDIKDMAELLDTELFTDGSDWSHEDDASDYLVLEGRLSWQHNKMLFTTKSITIPLPKNCRFEPSILQGYTDTHNLRLLIACDGIDMDPLVVTPQLYHLSTPFPSMFDRRFFLEEILMYLSDAQRTAICHFLQCPGFAQYCFLSCAYIASLKIKKANTLSPADNLNVIEATESLMRNYVAVHFEKFNLFSLISIIELSGLFNNKNSSLNTALALWAIFNRASAWGNLPAEEVLMISGLGNASRLHSYLKLVCSPAELSSLASSIADPVLHDTDPAQAENILLELLYTGTALKSDTISVINRHLFHRRPIRLEDIRKLTPIRYSDSPNWSILLDDLFEKVSIQLSKGSTAYARGLALAWMCEIGDISLSDAQIMILEGESDAATLVGIHMLSLLLQYDLSNTSKKRKPVQVELAQPIMKRLTDWLIKYDDLHYTAAAILARDLVYWGADPTPLIADPRVRETALLRKAMGIGNRLYPCIVLNLINRYS